MNIERNRVIVLIFLITLFACKDEVNNTLIETPKSISEILPKYLNTEGCVNIFLIKKNDCLACEQVAQNMLNDSSLIEHSIIINENIRDIEKEDYLNEHPYLKDLENTLFNSDIIKQLSDFYNLSFDTSLLIVLNENKKVIVKGRLKILVGDSKLIQQICD